METTSFHLSRWRCQCDGAELCSEKGKCGSQYQSSSRYLSRDFNPEGHDITKIRKKMSKKEKNRKTS